MASVSGLIRVSSSNTTNHLKYSLISDGRLSSVSDIEVFRVDYTGREKDMRYMYREGISYNTCRIDLQSLCTSVVTVHTYNNVQLLYIHIVQYYIHVHV